MKIRPTFEEGVNKIKHMGVGKLKRKAEQKYNFHLRDTCNNLTKKIIKPLLPPM